MGLVTFLIVGLIAGFVARWLVGGPGMGWIGTLVLGIVGSFVGGTLAGLVFGGGSLEISSTGIVGSIIGAIIVLLVWKRFGGGVPRMA